MVLLFIIYTLYHILSYMSSLSLRFVNLTTTKIYDIINTRQIIFTCMRVYNIKEDKFYTPSYGIYGGQI